MSMLITLGAIIAFAVVMTAITINNNVGLETHKRDYLRKSKL